MGCSEDGGPAQASKRGRGKRPAPTREVEVSKKLSWLLRHGAEQEGLKLLKGGYLPVSDVLATKKFRGVNPKISLAEIREIVTSNEKQRFSLLHRTYSGEEPADAIVDEKTFVDDENPAHWLIRANQGHSIKVDTADLLTPITIEAGNLPPLVVHGSRREHWPKILTSGGLKPMTRNHVHFATGVPSSIKSSFIATSRQLGDDGDKIGALDNNETSGQEVKSGMRNTSTLLIFVNLKAALEDGVRFWMSENGVVLSEGNNDGLIPLKLFDMVETKDGKVLLENGLPKEDTAKS